MLLCYHLSTYLSGGGMGGVSIEQTGSSSSLLIV